MKKYIGDNGELLENGDPAAKSFLIWQEMLKTWMTSPKELAELNQMLIDCRDNQWHEKLVSMQRPESYYTEALKEDFNKLLIDLTSPDVVEGGEIARKVLYNEVARACVKTMYLLQSSFRVHWDLSHGPLEDYSASSEMDKEKSAEINDDN